MPMPKKFLKKPISLFEKKVYEAVALIPKGRVSTYGFVAEAIGMSHAGRAVGNALHHNPFHAVPCHRVIRADGHIGGFVRGPRAKSKLLQKEGVLIRNGRANPDSIVRLQPLS